MATPSFFSQALRFLFVFCASNLERIKSQAKAEPCNSGLAVGGEGVGLGPGGLSLSLVRPAWQAGAITIRDLPTTV